MMLINKIKDDYMTKMEYFQIMMGLDYGQTSMVTIFVCFII